jgi:hypothetical protein
MGQLYDNFEPDVKEILLEKDREIRAVEQNKYLLLQQYEKRLKVLEKKIHDLQNVGFIKLWQLTQLIMLQENELLEGFIRKLRELPISKVKKS